MKFPYALLVLTAFSAAVIAAEPLPAGHPRVEAKKQAPGAPAAQLPQKARVLNTIDVPQYTYLEVTQNSKSLWIAGPTVVVKNGDVVRFDNGMPMSNFHSKSLNRTFPSILFVNSVVVTKEKD